MTNHRKADGTVGHERRIIVLNELISVIVPVYNVAPYLEKCIDTIISQSYYELEILLIDDGSTDDSGKICDAYKAIDSRVSVIHQDNRGLSAARNIGIDNAHGNWLFFVDSDDILRDDAIEALYQTAKFNGVKMVVGDYQEFETYIEFKDSQDFNVETLSVEEALKELIINQPGRWVTVWAKIYDRKLFDGIRFPLGRVYEDTYIMHLLLEKAGRIAKLNHKIYGYRQSQNSIMGTYGLSKINDLYTAYLLRIDFLRKNRYFDLYQQQKNLMEWKLHEKYMKADKVEKKEWCKIYRKYYFNNFGSFTWKYRIIGFVNCVLHKM